MTNVAVNVPKTRRTYCKGKNCRKHTVHKVTQYKTGKASVFAQVCHLNPRFSSPALIFFRESDDTIENKAGMVVKQNLCSTRRYLNIRKDRINCFNKWLIFVGKNDEKSSFAFGVQ